jgi:hypothetical protein
VIRPAPPKTAELMCSQSTPCAWPKATPQVPLPEGPSVGRQANACDAKRSLSVGGGRSGRKADDPVRVSATPRGASGLAVGPAPDAHRSYSNTFPPHLSTRGFRAVAGPTARTGGRPRGACGQGGTTDGADLLSAGHSPHSFGLVTGPFLPVMAQPQAGHALMHRGCAWCTGLSRYASRRGTSDQLW